jgi:succinoglycan biosynthesis protein ExoL
VVQSRAEGEENHVFRNKDALSASRASPDLVAAPAVRRRLVAYFGPDVDDPAARRRVAQWRYAGFGVLPLAFSRDNRARRGQEEFISLGRVMPLSRMRRVLPLALAAIRLVARRRVLAVVDLFIARNLDIALLALFARWAAGSSAPVVYEVLDINPSCTKGGWQGALMRLLERWVLARANLLVVSSPYFGTDYYEAILHYRRPWFLLENKIPRWVSDEQRPPAAIRGAAPRQAEATGKRPWRIGWFGYLDDEKSWDILRSMARELPQQVEIHVRGRPYTNFDMTRFLADVEQLGNVIYGGPYRNPEDLAEAYGAVDIVWSIDCNFPTANSKWLLTNGLYEAGYFGKPALGLLGTAVGEFLSTNGSGWCLNEPLAESLLEFARELTAEEYEAKRELVAGLSRDLFVETDDIPRLWTLLQSKEETRLEGGLDATSPAALSPHEL